jgi:hypothetical protein
MFLSATSCRSAEEGKLAEKHTVYFNQSLLKDAVPYMARIWGTSIVLDSDVASIIDLSVDYSPGREVTLKLALDEILNFIKTKHGVSLRWREQDSRITIERHTTPISRSVYMIFRSFNLNPVIYARPR